MDMDMDMDMALAKTSAYPRQGDVRPFFPDGKDTERGEKFSPVLHNPFPSFPPRARPH